MKSTFGIEKPDEVEATMTITMKIKEWRALKNQLGTDWPSWKLSSHISSVVSLANKTFFGEHKGEQ